MKKEDEKEKPIEKEKEKKKPDLVISRLPEKTKEEFIKLANDEFCSDYGMCLKDCLDKRGEYLRQKDITENLVIRINDLESTIKKEVEANGEKKI